MGEPSKGVRVSYLLGVWLLISVVAGVGLTAVDWGDPERFHGTGFPFASVYWDRDRSTGRFVDYPNPYAMILNPSAVFLAGAVPLAAVRWLCRLKRKMRSVP